MSRNSESERIVTADTIKDYLDSKSDFSLEMKVLSHVNSLDFDTEHGGTYSDPVTDKSRQFDVRCSKDVTSNSIGREETKLFKLSVECKAISPEFPLVIQRVPRSSQESYHEIILSRKPEAGSLNFTGQAWSIRSYASSPIYPTGSFVGKACTQIGYKKDKLVSDDREVYEKWAQAIASAYDLITECIQDRDRLQLKTLYAVVIPVLVIPDNCLWHVDYNELGNRVAEPEHIDEIDFYIGKNYWKMGLQFDEYTVSHLKILTLSGFISFTERIACDASFTEQSFLPNSFS